MSLDSHWTCQVHGPFDAHVAVGCPECVRELRAERDAALALLRELPKPPHFTPYAAVSGEYLQRVAALLAAQGER